MQRVVLSSQAVASAGYDPERQELELEFTTGRTYRYFGVPQGVFDWLLRTPSKGAFVSKKIAEQYAYRDVTPAEPPPRDELLRLLAASLKGGAAGADEGTPADPGEAPGAVRLVTDGDAEREARGGGRDGGRDDGPRG